MRCSVLPVSVALLASACTHDSGEAYLHDSQIVNYLLNDDLPSRAWDVRITADQLGDLSGPLWCTLRMDTSVVADDRSPWHDIWVDLWLQGSELSEEHLYFQGPGSEAVPLTERYKTDCQAGEPCEWDFQYSADRRSGTAARAAAVVLSINMQVIVALGDQQDAPSDAQLYVDLQEMGQDTGTP